MIRSFPLIRILIVFICFGYVWALECGFPGKPKHGLVNVTGDIESRFAPGTVVWYSCREADRILRGQNIRICQENGTWSGSRPRCDVNIAYGRRATFVNEQEERDESPLTDGLTDPSDDQNCPSLSSTGDSSLTLDLGDTYTITTIFLHLQDASDDVKNSQMLLDENQCHQTDLTNNVLVYDCVQTTGRQKGRPMQGRYVRFQYRGNAPLNVCEIQIMKHPSGFECGTPETPANSHVATERKGSFEFTHYECLEGYELKGNDKRICHGTHWQGHQPICLPISSPVESNNLPETEVSSLAAKLTSRLSDVQTFTETVPSIPSPAPSTPIQMYPNHAESEVSSSAELTSKLNIFRTFTETVPSTPSSTPSTTIQASPNEFPVEFIILIAVIVFVSVILITCIFILRRRRNSGPTYEGIRSDSGTLLEKLTDFRPK